jgi:hypothetical protein
VIVVAVVKRAWCLEASEVPECLRGLRASREATVVVKTSRPEARKGIVLVFVIVVRAEGLGGFDTR